MDYSPRVPECISRKTYLALNIGSFFFLIDVSVKLGEGIAQSGGEQHNPMDNICIKKTTEVVFGQKRPPNKRTFEGQNNN